MKNKTRIIILVFSDIILVNSSLILAYLLRFDGLYANIPAAYLNHYINLALMATMVKLCCYYFFKLYSSLWRYASIYELFSIGAAALLSNSLLLGFISVSGMNVPRSIPVITFFTDVIFIGGIRFTYRIFRRLARGRIIRSVDKKRILIIGGGNAGSIIIKELMSQPELKSHPVAIIDDDRKKLGSKINGVPIVGTREDIVNTVNCRKIDEIILAIPSATKSTINEIYSECSGTHCKIKILPSVRQLIDESVTTQKIRNVNIEDLLGRDPVDLDIGEISSYLEGKAVLVTGGGGSIGSELCRQIASFHPRQLIILDNYENNAYDLQNELLYIHPNLSLTVVIANIREKQRLEIVFRKFKPDVVFHAAAHKHVPLMELNPTEAIKNNVFGTLNLAECADKFGVKKFVLISTDKAVNPTNIMGATKRMAEMIIQASSRYSSTEFTAVRFGNVLGSNGSVIPLFRKQIEKGGPVTVTHPKMTRFFMTIPEAAQLVIQAGAMAKGGEIFVLDMGQPVKIYELAKNLIRLSGYEPEVDIKIQFSGLRPGEKLFEELLLEEEGIQATKNNKIFIAKPVFTDLAMLKREIGVLNEVITNNADSVMDYMTNIVPTYKRTQEQTVENTNNY